jgi:hypothetical protein
MVRKKSLLLEQKRMSSVDVAKGWASDLIRREARGPGDLDNAMRRLEARYGVPYSTWWSLRYRPPKDMLVTVFDRLRDAYRAECERQIKRLEHDITITKAIAGADSAAVCAAEALVGAKEKGR